MFTVKSYFKLSLGRSMGRSWSQILNFLLLLELKKTSIYNNFFIRGSSSLVERIVAND